MGACRGGLVDRTPDEILIVATTGILGDIASNIAGDQARVEILVPVGADPHDYQATSGQVALMLSADLVVANGLGLEESLSDALDTIVLDGANLLEVAPELDPQPISSGSSLDPHFWLDPLRVAGAAQLIAGALRSLAPEVDWSSSASQYTTELLTLDEEIQATLGAVAAQDRRLVTNHDSLGYFASRYDFEVVGVAIPGGSTMADSSSAAVAALVETLETERLGAIFAETTESSALVEAVAADIGWPVEIVLLHTGSLGPSGSGADTLVDMLRTNAQLISAALSREAARPGKVT